MFAIQEFELWLAIPEVITIGATGRHFFFAKLCERRSKWHSFKMEILNRRIRVKKSFLERSKHYKIFSIFVISKSLNRSLAAKSRSVKVLGERVKFSLFKFLVLLNPTLDRAPPRVILTLLAKLSDI